jgi:hypothetical protein
MIVSIVGIHVLHNDVYYDLEILIYCCVIAASQYSLLKSCQPDVNTPVHVTTKFFFSIFIEFFSRVLIVILQSVVQYISVYFPVYYYRSIN